MAPTNKVILLTGLREGPELEFLIRLFEPSVPVTLVHDRDGLLSAPVDESTTLLSVGSGVIVPEEFLALLSRPAYNMHAAPPQFPGRDPHHHAIYHGATTYGATLHIMTPRVDEGAIVDVEMFAVGKDATPESLLAEANAAGLRLIEKHRQRLLDKHPLPEMAGITWGSVKTRRGDLLKLGALTPLISKSEFDRRVRALAFGDHKNLTVRLHGHTFRIEKGETSSACDTDAFAQFTEAGFTALLRQLKAGGYRFARFGDRHDDRHVLWRHDVDASMHRAQRLAEIEAEEGVQSTYFVNPRSAFYNLFEPGVQALVQRILALGHEIGLHFDAAAYPDAGRSAEALDAAVRREAALLQELPHVTIRAVSWHNPSLSNLLAFTEDRIAGLINVYSARLRQDYTYCSDSNGYWRFKPMDEVIREGHARLHLLTHPEWWTPEAMSPSDRIDRAILGRARRVRDAYDKVLEEGGRKNVAGDDA